MNQVPDDFRKASRPGGTQPGLLSKILAFAGLAALATIGFMFSVVVLAVAAVAAVFLGTYLWWKTRAVRKMMREQRAAGIRRSGGEVVEGEVIEGEAVIVREYRTSTGRVLPPGDAEK